MKKRAENDAVWLGVVALAVAYIAVSVNGGEGIDVGSLGPLHIYLGDLFILAFGIISIKVILTRSELSWPEVIVLGILALSTLQFLYSYSIRGTAAGVDFRRDAMALTALLFFSQLGKHYSQEGFQRLFGILTAAAAFIYIARASGLLGISDYYQTLADNGFIKYRYLDSDEALWILYFGMSIFGLELTQKNFGKLTSRLVFGVGVLLSSFALMHRSVWLSEIVALALFPLICYRISLIERRLFKKILSVSAVVTAVAVVLVLNSSILTAAVEEIQKPNSTMMWRILGWQYLLDEVARANPLVGLGYGTGLGRWVGMSYVVASAHNILMDEYTRLGVFGLLLYLSFFSSVLFHLYRIAVRDASIETKRMAALLLVLGVCDFIYEMAYAMSTPSFLLWGYAMGFLREQRTTMASLPMWLGGAKKRSATRAASNE